MGGVRATLLLHVESEQSDHEQTELLDDLGCIIDCLKDNLRPWDETPLSEPHRHISDPKWLTRTTCLLHTFLGTFASNGTARTLNVCSRTIRRRLDSFGLQRYTMIDDTELVRNIRSRYVKFSANV